MSPLAVLFAATALAADPPHHAAQPNAAAHQQQKYEQAVRHQMEQERRAMQHAVEQQQRSIHEQMKDQLQAQRRATSPYIASTPVAPRGYAGRPYAHHSGSGYHHRPSHRYSHRRTWPSAQDPELAALQHLKQTLDAVRMGHAASAGQQSAIELALMRVVEVPTWPSVASMNRLAGHVNHALAGRGSAAIDTGTMALMLRGGVNAPLLIAAERAEVNRDLQAALRHGQVRPEHVAAVVAALHDVEHQEQARR